MTNGQYWNLCCVATALLSLPAIGRADVVQDWNAIMQLTVSSQPPFPQARLAAITQLAVFEAVNAITHEYKPYLGTVAGDSGASPEAAAIAAAHAVLRNYFPASAPSLDAISASSLAAIPNGPAKTAGISIGEAAAAAMIGTRANDGSAPPGFFLPTSSEPGQWQLTPSCTSAGGAFFHWQNVTPFGLPSAGQFHLNPPPPLNSALYTRAFNEVREVGDVNSTARPQDRTNVAVFYASISPVGVFNGAARQISAAQGKSLAENARDFALINIAISDAAVATFHTKYLYNFWRPETAIQNAATDGNNRTQPATFKPLITAPCFPSYPSAHGTLSNAARSIMEQVYGDGPFSIMLTAAGMTRNYSSLTEITDDISDARVFGGIHFRTDQDAGEALGVRIGQYVYTHNLWPAHGEGADDQ